MASVESTGGWVPTQDHLEVMASKMGFEVNPIDDEVQGRLMRAASQVEHAGNVGANTLDRTMQHFRRLEEQDREAFLTAFYTHATRIRDTYMDEHGYDENQATVQALADTDEDFNSFFERMAMNGRSAMNADDEVSV